MKVLHVYRTCYPETNGGVEQVIRSITDGVKNLGVTSKILTLSRQSKEPYYVNGIEVITIKKDIEIASNGFSIKLIKKFKTLSKWADIIHCHYPWPTGDLLMYFWGEKPSIVTYHSDIVRQRLLHSFYKPLESKFLNKVNLIVATSPNYANSSKNLLKYKSKVKIIPLAIDEKNYLEPSEDEINKWRRKVGEGYFLFIGVLRYYKGLDYLIEAAAINNLPVIIAGDGPLRHELEKKATDLGLHNIIFLGFISERDKASLLKLSKAFIFPSHLRSEAFGISLLEAQLFSKPLISCDVGTGSSYVNQHLQTGIIVPPANPQALSEAMIQLENDSNVAARYGKQGNLRLEKHFRNEIQCEKYLELYKYLLRLS
jgi:glycosyltransferase involved in cell wall biosynthesis